MQSIINRYNDNIKEAENALKHKGLTKKERSFWNKQIKTANQKIKHFTLT